MSARRVLVAILFLGASVCPGIAQGCGPDCLMTGPYASFAVESQLLGADYERREMVFAAGRALAFGERGDWTGLLEARAGFIASQRFADGLVAGPRLTLTRTLAGHLLEVDPGTRSELYVGLSAGAAGTWLFQGHDKGLRLMPTVGLALGFRLPPGQDGDDGVGRRNGYAAELFWEGRWPDDVERLYLRFAVFKSRPGPPNGAGETAVLRR